MGCEAFRSACVYVCLFVCMPFAYLKNLMSEFNEFFCTCYLQLWLGPPLTTVQYVMYFRFCGWPDVFTRWGQWPRIKDRIVFRRVGHVAAPVGRQTLCLVEFARWRHRGQSCCAGFFSFVWSRHTGLRIHQNTWRPGSTGACQRSYEKCPWHHWRNDATGSLLLSRTTTRHACMQS